MPTPNKIVKVNSSTLKMVSRLSARTKRRIKPSEVKVCVCQAPACGARFEIHDVYQSEKLCLDCRPAKRCIHGAKTTEKCEDCKRMHGNYFMRTF